ncbi:MAG TPA: glycosyltransferase family 39 protein [Candidatus Limnocylindrales bacterium]|nr:glycosyltransferase family 39 protein [Candidatus Limnocylindrales bacterium]
MEERGDIEKKDGMIEGYGSEGTLSASSSSRFQVPISLTCALLVAGFGALLGYFVWNTYANRTLIHSYPLSWGNAQWIATQTEAPQGYFRKNLYLPRKVNHAWIKVAAPDSYTLLVNGISVGKKTFHAINVSGVYDITPYLRTGKNVIGVLVRLSVYPGTGRTLVEGAYVDDVNQETRFISDGTWKVKIVEERQGEGTILWSSPSFDDGNWPFAKVLGPANIERVYPLNVDYGATEDSVTAIEIPPTHPQLITEAPHGEWIWYPDPEVRTAYFQKVLDLSHRIREVWIRVAASQRYNLEVNGIEIASIDQSLNPTIQSTSTTNIVTSTTSIAPVTPTRSTNRIPAGVPQNPAEGTGSPAPSKSGQLSGSLDIYNITPFIHPGSNRIGVSVHGERSSQALLVDGLMVHQNGEVEWFKSDSSWKTLPVEDLSPQHSLETVPSKSLLKDARIVGKYPDLPWGLLKKNAKIITLPSNLQTIAWLLLLAYMLAGALIMVFFWILSGYLRYRLNPESIRQKAGRSKLPVGLNQALSLDTLAHVPPALFLGICYLLQYDVRFDYSFPFQPWIIAVAILLLIGFKLAFILEAKKVMRNGISRYLPSVSRLPVDTLTLTTLEESKKFQLGCLLVILICGTWLRIHNIDFESINGDECGTLRDALSILVRGYAFRTLGIYEKPLVTYELLPYPISISFLLFGVSDFALRLPSALYGIFSIFLIFYVGSKLFNKRIGLLASAIFAFIPLSIHWAQNDRYPQPTHTLGLIVSYLFYRAINEERIRPRYIYPIAVLYIWMFLTWEGTGFMLGALALGLVLVRWKDYKWIKEPHLWAALIGIVTVVLVQGFRRKVYTAKYLVIGEGLLSGVTLAPVFFDPLYDPYYYVDNFFRAENHSIMTALSLVGLPLFVMNPGLRFFATILITVWFLFTNLFPLPTNRYLYHVQPYLIILAAATCVYYGDYLISLGKGVISQTKSWINTMILVIPLLVLFLATNPFILQLYRLSSLPNTGVVDTRYRTYQSDQKTSNQYIRDHWQEGDYVISATPDVTKYYAGQSDAFLESFTTLIVVYAEQGKDFILQDKSIGVPSLIGLRDLKDAVNQHQRVWIAAVPNSMFNKLNTPEVLNYINTNFKVVYESYNAKIYLWEK